MRILIVEDNEISAGILESNLHQRHYETLIARTGTEALQMLESKWDICLVIADIMMPEMNGLDLVRHMREDPKLQELPVIICTSVADSEHVGQAVRLGCRHYLLKPVDRVQLLMMVEKLLAGQRPVPVLGDRNKISAKYGLSAESLDRIFKSFARLVEENIGLLSSEDSRDPKTASIPNIARLVEGAVTLGAERLAVPLQALQAKGAQVPPTPEERSALLEELKWVRRALASELAPEPPAPVLGQPSGKSVPDQAADSKTESQPLASA